MDKRLLLEKLNTNIAELFLDLKDFLRTMDKSDPQYKTIQGLYDYIRAHDLQTESLKCGPTLTEGAGHGPLLKKIVGSSPMLKKILESKSVDKIKERILVEGHDYYDLGKWKDLSFEERKTLTDLLDNIYGEAYLPYKAQSGGFAKLVVHDIDKESIQVHLTSGVMPQDEEDSDPTEEMVVIDRKTMKVTDVEPFIGD